MRTPGRAVDNRPRHGGVRDLRPPLKPPSFLLVGCDSEGIAAVSYRTEVDGPRQVHIELMAIANRHRHRADVFIGDELAQATLDEIIDRALQDNDYVGQVSVTALIHPENKASKRLCERMGLERTGVADSGYENWSAELFFADWSAITGARGRADTFALSAVVVPTRV